MSRAVAALCLGASLSACVGAKAPLAPMTLPPVDGRAEKVSVGTQDFVINRQPAEPVQLRVTRLDGRDLDYSEGAIAKKAAQAYCAAYNRGLDPAAMGRFSAPNSWIFAGDCQ